MEISPSGGIFVSGIGELNDSERTKVSERGPTGTPTGGNRWPISRDVQKYPSVRTRDLRSKSSVGSPGKKMLLYKSTY
jgi:hypothetical protein